METSPALEYGKLKKKKNPSDRYVRCYGVAVYPKMVQQYGCSWTVPLHHVIKFFQETLLLFCTKVQDKYINFLGVT